MTRPTIQLIKGDSVFSPASDLAYIWPALIRTIFDRLRDGRCEPLQQWADQQGVRDEDLTAAVVSLGRLMGLATETDLSLGDAMREAGLDAIPWAARGAVLQMAGLLVMGSAFRRVRDAGAGRLPGIADMLRAGEELADLVSGGRPLPRPPIPHHEPPRIVD